MKQKPLMGDELAALVAYRIQRAKDTLKETDILLHEGHYNAAVNRLYYACYYAVTALLVKNNIAAETHSGVKQMFSLHFVAAGKISKQYSIFYSRLFNDRISGDYDDFVIYDREMLIEIRPKAEDFITSIEKLVNQ
ncbi:MAG: HEPN domain-containing protein [Prevotellaceae bacterium]|jgi:uncharacterized protein (UPF0332 family)|nr:HEPN domain-containing protein [Prevotellaceae bacterium]